MNNFLELSTYITIRFTFVITIHYFYLVDKRNCVCKAIGDYIPKDLERKPSTLIAKRLYKNFLKEKRQDLLITCTYSFPKCGEQH